MSIESILTGIGAFVIGAIIASLIMWGVQRVKIADLERDVDRATIEKITMQEQWEQAVNELTATRVVLNDTFAALELLRKYQSVDKDIQKDIDKIDDTLTPEGEATEDTYSEFRKMMEDFNQLNGNIPTATDGRTLGILTLDPFVELREDAEELFKTVTDMVLEYEK